MFNLMPSDMESHQGNSKIGEVLGRVIAVGLFVLMVFTTLAFGTVEPWSVAVFSLSVVILLLLWAVKVVFERRLKLILPETALPLVVVIGYGILQGITTTDEIGRRWSISMDAEATRLALEVAGCLLIALLLAANFFTGRKRLDWLRNFLIFFGLTLSVFGLVQHFTWNGNYYWFVVPSLPPSAPFGPFVNHNHFAGFIEMIVPIPVALVLTRAVRGELSLLYGFSAALMSVATIVSLSRGGTISLVSGIMFVIIFGLRPAMLRETPSNSLRFPLFLSRVAAAAVIAVIIGAGVWWVGSDAVISRVEKSVLSSDEPGKDFRSESFYRSRGWIWRDTVSLIRQNWAMGVGLGAFPTAYTIYSKQDGLLVVNQAHNDYLQVLADCGIVGAIAALCFIVLVFRDMVRAFRHRDATLAAMALGCSGGVFAMLVHSLFDFNLQLPSNALLFLVLTAAIYSISRTAAEGRVNGALLMNRPRFRGVTRQLEV